MSIGNIVKHVNVPFETIVSVALWDLPGREEMDLRRSYYKDVDAAIGKKYNSGPSYMVLGNQHNPLMSLKIQPTICIGNSMISSEIWC